MRGGSAKVPPNSKRPLLGTAKAPKRQDCRNLLGERCNQGSAKLKTANPLSGLSPLDGRAYDARPFLNPACPQSLKGPSAPAPGTRRELTRPGATA